MKIPRGDGGLQSESKFCLLLLLALIVVVIASSSCSGSLDAARKAVRGIK